MLMLHINTLAIAFAHRSGGGVFVAEAVNKIWSCAVVGKYD
jgi:hypothetical protein